MKEAVGASLTSPVYFEMKHIITDTEFSMASKSVKSEILVDGSFIQSDLSLISLIKSKVTSPN